MSEHRTLRFASVDDAMAEAERLAASDVRTSGSYSLGQIFEHLARTFEIVVGERFIPPASLPMRVMSRILKPLALRKAMTGYKLPSQAQSVLWPTEDLTTEEGIRRLRETYEKFRSTEPLPKHVFFGNMTRAQHEQLQCRHFECHLGFVHPTGS